MSAIGGVDPAVLADITFRSRGLPPLAPNVPAVVTQFSNKGTDSSPQNTPSASPCSPATSKLKEKFQELLKENAILMKLWKQGKLKLKKKQQNEDNVDAANGSTGVENGVKKAAAKAFAFENVGNENEEEAGISNTAIEYQEKEFKNREEDEVESEELIKYRNQLNKLLADGIIVMKVLENGTKVVDADATNQRGRDISAIQERIRQLENPGNIEIPAAVAQAATASAIIANGAPVQGMGVNGVNGAAVSVTIESLEDELAIRHEERIVLAKERGNLRKLKNIKTAIIDLERRICQLKVAHAKEHHSLDQDSGEAIIQAHLLKLLTPNGVKGCLQPSNIKKVVTFSPDRPIKQKARKLALFESDEDTEPKVVKKFIKPPPTRPI